MKRHLLLGLAVGALFMVLAFWGVPFGDFEDAFLSMDWRYLPAIAALFLVQESLRALRQWVMLRPVAPAMSYRSSVSIFFLSFFCIHAFPARLGEFVRPWLLKRREGVALGSGLGMVVAERAVDLVAALGMLWMVLAWAEIPGVLTVAGAEIPLVETGRALGMVAVPAALAGCLGLAFFDKPMLALGARLVTRVAALVPNLERPGRVGLGFAETFARGFASFRSPGKLAAIGALTVMTWSTTTFIYLLMAPAFGLGALVGLPQALGVMVITMLGSLLPAPPGMAGVQEAFGRGALALFGISGPGLDAPALAYAVTVHWYQVILQASVAAYFFWRDGESLRDMMAGAQATEQEQLS